MTDSPAADIAGLIAKLRARQHDESFHALIGQLPKCDDCSLRDEAAAALERLQRKLKEYGQSFDLRWKADMRAIKRWQAEKPSERELTWPDHADLCVWLLDERDALSAEVQRLRAENARDARVVAMLQAMNVTTDELVRIRNAGKITWDKMVHTLVGCLIDMRREALASLPSRGERP